MDIRRLWRVSCGAVLLAGACRTAPAFDARSRGALAQTVIAGWPDSSRVAATLAIERYGPPDAIAENALGWKRTGPWKRVVVSNSAEGAAARSAPELEETVSYRVPASKRGDLAEFDRGVRVSEDGSELSARSSDESMNFLALNLAGEIVRGARDPADARRTYDRIAELAVAGKSSAYTRGLLLPPR